MQIELEETLAQARRITVEVMLSDLELAATFLDTAAASRDPQTAARCHRHALDCYVKMQRRLLRAGAAPELRANLVARLDALRRRLCAYYDLDGELEAAGVGLIRNRMT
jgi:hypothetical protein